MISDQDVADLYRCLLGRAPESPGTVAAFRLYYPDFDSGRRAVLRADEFTRMLDRLNGHVAADLTRCFLTRAGGAARQDAAPVPGLTDTMRLMLQSHGAVRLAVVIGQDGPSPVALLPLENAQAAILHVAPDFPAFLPQTGQLQAGGALFRIGFDAPALAAFLQQAGLTIDVLALMGAPPLWWDALRPCLSARAILVAGADTPFPDPDWPDLEPPLHLPGIAVRHQGGWFLPVTYQPPAAAAVEETAVTALTIAAIVRNEQDAIVNMLRSAAPVAGSFVVLDTGSTDDTFARAKDCLAALGKPYVLERAEPGRFDVMRNAALDLVPASADWVLMLDADEELCAEDRAALRDLLPVADHDAYALPRYNYLGVDKSGVVAPYPDRQARLLRCHAESPVRYSGAVHETIAGVAVARLPPDATMAGGARGGPHIHHLVRRFRSPDAEARKQAYYRDMAEAARDQAVVAAVAAMTQEIA